MQAQKRTWREWRGTGWGEALYSGIYLDFDGVGPKVLVSKLGQRLHVRQLEEKSMYHFESMKKVVVTDTFAIRVKLALGADNDFQVHVTHEFDKVMSEG